MACGQSCRTRRVLGDACVQRVVVSLLARGARSIDVADGCLNASSRTQRKNCGLGSTAAGTLGLPWRVDSGSLMDRFRFTGLTMAAGGVTRSPVSFTACLFLPPARDPHAIRGPITSARSCIEQLYPLSLAARLPACAPILLAGSSQPCPAPSVQSHCQPQRCQFT